MSEFQDKNNTEDFEEVPVEEVRMSEPSHPVADIESLPEAVKVSNYDENSDIKEEEEGVDSSLNNVVPMKQIANGWNVVSGWMKKGVEKAVQVTNDTAEATAPARSQFYDMTVKMQADIAPATQVITEVAGSTLGVVSEALTSTTDIVSASLNNASQELSDFASEMQRGPPEEKAGEEPAPKATNISV